MRASTLTAIAAVTLAATLAGCGGTNSTTATSTSATTSAPVQSASATSAATHSTSAGRSTSAAVASFKADLTIQREGAALLALTNNGGQSVTIQGWPTLKFLGANNAPLAVPERKVEQPGAGPSITLVPGRTAFAGVKWVSGDKGDASTLVATSVSLTAPGHTTPVKVNLIGLDGKSGGYLELALKSVEVGTMQPSSQGVVF